MIYRLEAYVNGKWTFMGGSACRAEITRKLFALMESGRGWQCRIVGK